MKNILIFTPSQTDACAFYRSVGVFSHLRKITSFPLDIKFGTELNWAHLRMTDLVFLQRPFTANHAMICKMVKKQNKPLWIDFDDDLLNVPEWNPSYPNYSSQETKNAILECLSLADVVTVTTERLAQGYASINKNVQVIPNAFDDDLLNFKFKNKPRNRVICWRGSTTHKKDLNIISQAAINLSKVYPWKWVFMGDHPWFVDFMDPKNVVILPGVDIIDYLAVIEKLNPAIQVVPLFQHDFNLKKSNIAWLEATYAGAVTLAPDWDEWNKDGVQKYTADFGSTLERLINDEKNHQKYYQQSYNYIKENLLLSKVNEKRRDLLTDFLK